MLMQPYISPILILCSLALLQYMLEANVKWVSSLPLLGAQEIINKSTIKKIVDLCISIRHFVPRKNFT